MTGVLLSIDTEFTWRAHEGGASLEDLRKAPGVSAAVAQTVYDFYHSR